MLKLGYTVDFGEGVPPQDFHTGANTSKRLMLRNAQSALFLVHMNAAASGTDDLVFTLNEHTAASGGTTTALAAIATAWVKSATALAGTETWTKISQAAGSTLTLAGATYATKQLLCAVQINTKDVDDGYDYVSLSCAATAAVSRIGSITNVLTDLTIRRDPAQMAATLF
jgi:hypothetical protein